MLVRLTRIYPYGMSVTSVSMCRWMFRTCIYQLVAERTCPHYWLPYCFNCDPICNRSCLCLLDTLACALAVYLPEDLTVA
eukprot:6109654-Pyramimonas_sp.AAC.1